MIHIDGFDPAGCDSAFHKITPDQGLRVDLFGGSKADISFDLRLRIASAEGDTAFYHEGVTLTGVSAFEIAADWRPFGDSAMIITGSDPGGTLSDTVFVENQTEIWWKCGDADGSGGVDIDDAVYLVTYIFNDGPAPVPSESGDANCSGDVDIDDVVSLIAYIFSAGNSPCDTDGDEVPDC